MAIIALLILATVFGVYILLKQPRADRDWSLPLSKVAQFEQTDTEGTYTLQNLRAWEYGLEGALRKEWETAQVNVDQLEEVWFFIEPFAGTPLFAHSFLSFVFVDEEGERQSISISVEARKEQGEAYSPLRGVFRAYELLYVWSTEKDILSRIAIKLDHPLYAYKLQLSQDRAAAIFNHFINRTNDLASTPRFYSTLHSNCTNELAKAVNDAFPGALPWHRSWIITGRSAKWLHKLGFVGDEDMSFEALTKRSNIKPYIKENAEMPADVFDDMWRQSLTANF